MAATVTLEGNVGQDPEIKYVSNSSTNAICNLRVVTSRGIKQEDGSWENTEETWWTVTAFNRLAENVVDSLSKGDPVIVTGRAFIEKYKNRDGEDRQNLKVIAYKIGLDFSRRTAEVYKMDSAKNGAREPSAFSENDFAPF